MNVQVKNGIPKNEQPNPIDDLKKQQADLTFTLMMKGVI